MTTQTTQRQHAPTRVGHIAPVSKNGSNAVPVRSRGHALSRRFGRAAFMLEQTVYTFADALLNDYNGGEWTFYDTPITGPDEPAGFFMAPLSGPLENGQWRAANPDNYSDETVSAEAAGIICCLYAYSHLSFKTPLFADWFHRLREYALDHPEAGAIFRVID